MIHEVDGPRFARALRAGALEVSRRREHLDAINVFPVPDADTGTNMAATMRAAAESVLGGTDRSLGVVARRVADAAIDGARGNSGNILAQFFHGIAEALGDAPRAGLEDFAAAMSAGALAARQALDTPREGTILSVFTAWSNALDPNAVDLDHAFASALDAARIAVAATEHQLEVLEQNHVVDAGAEGFLCFLEGVAELFENRHAARWQTLSLESSEDSEEELIAGHAEMELDHRFCTEGLIRGEDLDPSAIRAAVRELGSSLVIAGGGSRVRVHLHTNEPRRFLGLLSSFGRLERSKIDDMVLQQLAAHGQRVVLVTDSSCDLPESSINRLGVLRVALQVTFGDDVYDDGIDLTPARFYDLLEEAQRPPTTSQPPVGRFRDRFRDTLLHHQSVLAVHLSGALSGTLQASRRAAEQLENQQIRVVDSRQASVGLGLIVEAVAEALLEGIDVEEAAQVAEAAARATVTYALILKIEMTVRGGRVKPGAGWLIEHFGLKPVIRIGPDGTVKRDGLHFGLDRALDGVARRVLADTGKNGRFLIGHARDLKTAEDLKARLLRLGVIGEISITELGAALAVHAGPGCIAVAGRRAD